jgi:hypothetical protein
MRLEPALVDPRAGIASRWWYTTFKANRGKEGKSQNNRQ